jgi:hypothetical protein
MMGMLCNVLLREELIYPDIPRVLYSMPVPAIARHVTLYYITPLCVTVEHPVTSRCQIFTQVCHSAPYYIRRASSRRYICLWVLYITRVLCNTMSYIILLYNMVLHNWVLCMIHFFFASKFALFATVFHFFATPSYIFATPPYFFATKWHSAHVLYSEAT